MAGDDGSLRRIRTRPQQIQAGERELLDAVLELVGERGYGALTLSALLERTGASNRSFHRHFSSIAECFERAYIEAAAGLGDELIAAGRAQVDWRSGFRAALLTLLSFVASKPQLARALLVEYRFGDERVRATHEELAQRATVEVDRARKEIEAAAGNQPPPLAARMVVGAIDFSIEVAIAKDETKSAEGMLGQLVFYAVMIFFGREAAMEELGIFEGEDAGP